VQQIQRHLYSSKGVPGSKATLRARFLRGH
jgi:hypothetical protein